MEDLKKETIKLKGASGKPVEMTLEELAKKKINGKIEVIDETYYVKLTRWYRLEQTFDNLKEAINALVKLVQKIDTIKMKKKVNQLNEWSEVIEKLADQTFKANEEMTMDEILEVASKPGPKTSEELGLDPDDDDDLPYKMTF